LIRDFPESTHVYLLGLERESDANLWKYVEENNFTVVTKDSDFLELATQNGPPPKVIWLNLGNCSTSTVLITIQNHINDIKHFIKSSELDILEIS